MAKCNTQANDMATTTNNWQTPGASNPGRYNEPADKGMEWEAQSAEEMGKKYYPLMGPGGGDELSLVGEPVRDVAGQISGDAQLLDVPLRDGGGHPLASFSGHSWRRLR